MSLRDALQAVFDERGLLTGEAVVSAWSSPDHPEHDRLTWDDSIAGHRYRVVEAAHLIRSVKITYRKSDKTPERATRYWQVVRGEDSTSYVPAHEVARDPVLTQLVLMDMQREWKQLRDRYSQFKEFAEMVAQYLDEAS